MGWLGLQIIPKLVEMRTEEGRQNIQWDIDQLQKCRRDGRGSLIRVWEIECRGKIYN